MLLRIFEFGLSGNLCEDERGFIIVGWVVSHLPILPLLSVISVVVVGLCNYAQLQSPYYGQQYYSTAQHQ